jgi:DNA repair protein RadC
MRKMKTILHMVIADALTKDAPFVDCAKAAALELKDIANSDRENFVVLVLDARRKCVGKQIVSVGTLSASLVHPREVFKPAIMLNAAGIVVAHNHPSGDPTPSAEDRDATRRLQKAGELLGIPVMDHVIVAGEKFFSFRETGIL